MAALLAILEHLVDYDMRRKTISMTLPLILLALLSTTASVCADDFALKRTKMLKAIESVMADTAYMTGVSTMSSAVRSSMGSVERHLFVPAKLRHRAYENRPLPIGKGQTISQPFIVALMTQLLDPKKGSTVLEVGTGSGYQAAVLAKIIKKVYSIEIVEKLYKTATARLKALGINNVQTRLGDGYRGWPEAAPFDGIIVTASASHIPPALIKQLKPGGIMVIPVGSQYSAQRLMVIKKGDDGALAVQEILPVLFVPFTREH